MVNFYEILSINRDANQKEIKVAFKKSAILYHPDKNLNNPKSEEKFKTINEAYQTLSNAQKKDLYDQKLAYFLYNKQQANKKPTYTTEPNPQASSSTPKEPYKPEDYSSQGKHYATTYYDHNKRSTINYVIAFTLIIIIATGALLLSLMMNKYTAQEHYKSALLHYETEDYPNAVKQLGKALEFDEKYAKAYELRGNIRYQFEKYELALPDFNLALKYYPDSNQVLLTKRDDCRMKIAEKLEDEKMSR